jgi:hypothetical protein
MQVTSDYRFMVGFGKLSSVVKFKMVRISKARLLSGHFLLKENWVRVEENVIDNGYGRRGVKFFRKGICILRDYTPIVSYSCLFCHGFLKMKEATNMVASSLT